MFDQYKLQRYISIILHPEKSNFMRKIENNILKKNPNFAAQVVSLVIL